MISFWTIAVNAFMELVRKPVFLALFIASSLFIVFLANIPYFGFGVGDRATEATSHDVKMVMEGSLAVMVVSGLFGAVLCASSSLSQEIQRGTALAVLAKPVGRRKFLLAKLLGLMGALAVMTYANMIAALLASRMGFDTYGNPDVIGSVIFLGAIFLALVTGGLLNYFLNRPFVANAVFLTIGAMTLAFLLINFTDKSLLWDWHNQNAGYKSRFQDFWTFTKYQGYNMDTGQVRIPVVEGDTPEEYMRGLPEPNEDAPKGYEKASPKDEFAAMVEWEIVPASCLILFALWVIGALALACSTRLGWMPSLMVCSVLFLLGLMSDYLFGRPAKGGAYLLPGESVVWTPPAQADAEGLPAIQVEPSGTRRARAESAGVRVTWAEDNRDQPEWREGELVIPKPKPEKGQKVRITHKELLEQLVGDGRKAGLVSFWIGPWGQGAAEIKGRELRTGRVWAKMLYVLVPNWQLFWLADAVGQTDDDVLADRERTRSGEGTADGDDHHKKVTPHIAFPNPVWKQVMNAGKRLWIKLGNWSGYVMTAFFYMAAYVGFALLVGIRLFENRELS